MVLCADLQKAFLKIRYSCIWRCTFALNMCIWNQTRVNCKQVTIKQATNNIKIEISSIKDGSKFNGQNSKVFDIRYVYGWSESTILLHWLQSNRRYKQFFHNRVKYANSKMLITLKCVDTIQKSADVASRVSDVKNLPKEWWYGPMWLVYSEKMKLHQQSNLKKKPR